ncbi:glycoside hydrolase family 130 protein [Algisphaera agarilytica]|uniref:Putative GH43/DUF377 family glycosyl hydrolase n=1 Tax=Algisphaera agarilytica TaxID=1385975 RepID=A0A7X0H333_9BACT|nr:hypothetical protein [Algisphaera agarilytica]MBB6428299.1 putative GH43/DUF377 family glycosyl hydrolase [Algisphaera agarilytica]
MPTLAPLITERRLILQAQADCPWANQMVLNPGVIRDPESGRLQMLFRATGNGQPRNAPAAADWPFPIYLGYAYSDNYGHQWNADFSKPALSPNLSLAQDELYIEDSRGRRSLNYANGCIEDPRLYWYEGKCHLIVACRVFPPGAYWEKDDPMQCAPAWAQDTDHGLGRAVRENVTVNLLYEVDLQALERGQYDNAFRYITHLTNPEFGENRDVLLFPRKLLINGQPKIVALHRPWESHHYPGHQQVTAPSIWYAMADSIDQLKTPDAKHRLLASPTFAWESNRIGASAPPLEVEPGLWLVSYHGKQDRDIGYTQSFMLLQETGNSLPTVAHRCSDRLMIPSEAWEQPGRFKTPCIFTTALVPLEDDQLMIVYGAADEKIGAATTKLSSLVEHVRRYDPSGKCV